MAHDRLGAIAALLLAVVVGLAAAVGNERESIRAHELEWLPHGVVLNDNPVPSPQQSLPPPFTSPNHAWNVTDNLITPFMRKHGIRPGFGFGRYAGKASREDFYSPLVGAGAGAKLQGLFVMPCFYVGRTNTGLPVSRFDTRYYSDDYTYEIDRTYYVGDINCTPSLSAIWYKTNLRGVVSYHGQNQVVPNATMAELVFTDGTYYFMDSFNGRAVVQELNQHCPCNVTWTTNKWFNVSASQCDPAPPGSSNLCQIITGAHDYFNYRWIDTTHYITSIDDFDQTTGWNNPLDTTYIRERIPESGNQDPTDCDYVLWAQCGAGIRLAESNCYSCTGLECDGCLFRELNPKWDPYSNDNVWYNCCPCIYWYGQRFDKLWLQTMC